MHHPDVLDARGLQRARDPVELLEVALGHRFPRAAYIPDEGEAGALEVLKIGGDGSRACLEQLFTGCCQSREMERPSSHAVIAIEATEVG